MCFSVGAKTQPESKCPELLANYCDMLLRKTPLSKKLTSEEVESKLRDVVCTTTYDYEVECPQIWASLLHKCAFSTLLNYINIKYFLLISYKPECESETNNKYGLVLSPAKPTCDSKMLPCFIEHIQSNCI